MLQKVQFFGAARFYINFAAGFPVFSNIDCMLLLTCDFAHNLAKSVTKPLH